MIKLIKRKTGNPYSKKPQYAPRWTSKGTVTEFDLATIMARGSTFSVGEVGGIMIDFPQYICDALLSGQSVRIRGLGTFKLKVSGRAKEDPNDLTTEGLKVSVVFTPDKGLTTRLNYESKFEFVNK